jgi:hypothetical protein
MRRNDPAISLRRCANFVAAVTDALRVRAAAGVGLLMTFFHRAALFFIMLVAISHANSAHALVVGTTSGTVPATTVNPASYAGWTQGDPGWANVVKGTNNYTYVYLGDSWVLSARHVGTGSIVLPTGTYERVNNSYYDDYGFQNSVANPPNMGLSPYTDLQLFRIKGTPNLPTLKVANEHFDLNPFPIPANSPELVTIGQGFTRAPFEGDWAINDSNPDDWVWYSSNPTIHKYGYFSSDHDAPSTPKVKAWGTNRLASTSSNSDLYETILSSTTGTVKLTSLANDVIVLTTSYDKHTVNGTNGATELESQAVSGDSGSAVFYKRNGLWELAGIVNAISTYSNQPASTAIYGQLTFMSDLSYYNQDYTNSIKNIMQTHANYSYIGDVNLDGIVSGNGSGPTSTDDVSAFIAGWGYNGGSPGNIVSWQKGDLNRDGLTNVSDFLLLRGALNGAISSAVLQSLFGSTTIPGPGGVPEPASAFLALFAAAAYSLLGRRRRAP